MAQTSKGFQKEGEEEEEVINRKSLTK